MGIRSAPLLTASSAVIVCAVLASAGYLSAQAAEPTPTPKSGAVKGRELPVREPVRREVQPVAQPVAKRGTRPVVNQPTVKQAEPAAPVAPAAGPAAATAATAAAAATPAAAPSPAADAWSEAEIREATAACTAVLRGVDAVYTRDDPIKQGSCGSPVVFKVTHVGKGPSVELSPPVMLTCEMIASLDKWMKADVQPKARSFLGGSVVRIDTMSSYSCRNAYGRTKSKLSEHGRVNAIDIGSFATAKDSVSVLADWGLTEREERALAAKREAERVARAAEAARRGTGAVTTTLPGSTIIPLPSMSNSMSNSNVGSSSARPPAIGLVPYRLGGPKGAGATAAVPALPQEGGSGSGSGTSKAKRNFIRDIHAAACKHFGTVLGPEANNAHKNHFHLDMAPRNRGNFCE